MVMKYMVFVFHILKVAVIGKMLVQSTGLMKTEEVSGNDLDTPT